VVTQPIKPLAASGFTLGEMMIALGLGIGLLAVLMRVFISLWLAVGESASAAEVTERAAFALNAIGHWGGESAAVAALHKAGGSLAMLNDARKVLHLRPDTNDGLLIESSGSLVPGFFAGCGSPALVPIDLTKTAMTVVAAKQLDCLSGPVEQGTSVLFLERRLLCETPCAGPGFFALVPSCDAVMPFEIRWMNRGSVPLDCAGAEALIRLQRQLIYLRPHSWRRGDANPALMLKRQSDEPSGRWLASDVLADSISGFELCGVSFDTADCVNDGRLVSALRVSVTAVGSSESFTLSRFLVPSP
jgi:hypothetical protein